MLSTKMMTSRLLIGMDGIESFDYKWAILLSGVVRTSAFIKHFHLFALWDARVGNQNATKQRERALT